MVDLPDDDKSRDKHVVPTGKGLSDAGSIPAASTFSNNYSRLWRKRRPNAPPASECSLDPRRRSLPAASPSGPNRKRQSALVEAFSLHACVHFHAKDRVGLENLPRCVARASADFVVPAENPLDDIENTRQLVSSWHGGKEIEPSGKLTAR